jgi:hypothetical protein
MKVTYCDGHRTGLMSIHLISISEHMKLENNFYKLSRVKNSYVSILLIFHIQDSSYFCVLACVIINYEHYLYFKKNFKVYDFKYYKMT